MAVFMDSGGGDIYAAETKQACLDQIKRDCPDYELSDAFEVSGDKAVRLEDEGTTTLEALYVPPSDGKAYCITSDNC